MRFRFLALLVALALVLIAAGCVDNQSVPITTAAPTAAPTAPPTSHAVTSVTSNTAQFASATTLEVFALGKNWDADVEDDGLLVHPWLKDATGADVIWRGATVPVDIEMWTMKFADTGYQKDQLVYKGDGWTIHSWNDEIRVPYDQMKSVPFERWGYVYATLHTPDGKTYAGVSIATGFTPES